MFAKPGSAASLRIADYICRSQQIKLKHYPTEKIESPFPHPIPSFSEIACGPASMGIEDGGTGGFVGCSCGICVGYLRRLDPAAILEAFPPIVRLVQCFFRLSRCCCCREKSEFSRFIHVRTSFNRGRYVYVSYPLNLNLTFHRAITR